MPLPSHLGLLWMFLVPLLDQSTRDGIHRQGSTILGNAPGERGPGPGSEEILTGSVLFVVVVRVSLSFIGFDAFVFVVLEFFFMFFRICLMFLLGGFEGFIGF